MRKTGWEEPSNGPDWIDVEMLMRALQGCHAGDVALVISPAGTGSSGGVCTVASLLSDVLPDGSLPESVTTIATWPCDTHKTLASHCFALLHELDFKVSEGLKEAGIFR